MGVPSLQQPPLALNGPLGLHRGANAATSRNPAAVKVFPVAERELRIAARRRGTYWVRFVAAGIAIACAAIVFLATLPGRASDQGQAMFVVLTILAFVYCLLSGVWTTSDSVSEEKRDGTLGLLFLTDLKGYDVVLGKLAANSIRAITSLVALLPVIGLPLMLGGVSASAATSVALLLLNTMFLSLAVGMFVSVLSRDARHAIGGTILIFLLLIALIPLGRWILVEYAIVAPPADPAAPPVGMTVMGIPQPLGWLLLCNPVMPLVFSFQTLLMGGTVSAAFWQALAVQHGIGWFALGSACWILPRVWQDRVHSRRLRTTATPGSGAVPRPAVAGAELLERHPFARIVVRDRKPVLFTWIGMGVIGIVWAWGLLELGDEWFEGIVALWTMFFAAFWLKLGLATVACRHLHEHRRTGALELLLSTPLTPDRIIQGHLVGLRRLFSSSVLMVLAASCLLCLATLRRSYVDGGEWLLTFSVGLGLFLLDLWTIAWVGMWQGARSHRYVRAYGLTIGLVLLLPWVLFILTSILIGVLVELTGLSPGISPDSSLVLFWWAFLCVVVDATALLGARRRLARRLRDLALGSYGPEPRTADDRPAVPGSVVPIKAQ